MTNYTWGPPLELHDGHSLFIYDQGDAYRVAIADKSGDTPDQTDDGVLFLNFDRSLSIGFDAELVRSIPLIPLVDEEGIESTTPTDIPTMLSLSHRFNWGINASGIMFTATRVGSEPGQGMAR